MLGKLPQQTFHLLAKTYGPIMLGNAPAIVISTPQAAELFLKIHDAVFASRHRVQSAEYFSYGPRAWFLHSTDHIGATFGNSVTCNLSVPQKLNPLHR
ncbi:hypothetical protein CRYUN_Cryun07bG0084900 [Craigia yunnanensis]